MHGFSSAFQSSGVSSMRKEKLQIFGKVYAIAIPLDAFAVKQTLAELNLTLRRVEVVGLRRGGAELASPDENTVIQAFDTIIIKGKPRRVERAERYLMTG